MNSIERSETSIYSAQKICLVREGDSNSMLSHLSSEEAVSENVISNLGLIRHWMMGCQRDPEQRMFPNGVIIVARWPATVGRVALAKMESTIHSAVLDAAASIYRKGQSHCR